MPYHYTACGLDDVWLANGFDIENDPEFGEIVEIEDIHGLHTLIADRLINQSRRLNGAEFRYLRVYMDLSQSRLAGLLDQKEQNIGNWERARTQAVKNGSAERLLRVIAASYLDENSRTRELVDELAALDAELDQPITVTRDEVVGVWHLQATAA